MLWTGFQSFASTSLGWIDPSRSNRKRFRVSKLNDLPFLPKPYYWMDIP
jgi:hypothetical protein